MHQSPLHSFHQSFGARMVDFAGWEMPILYTGIIEEHRHTREACSLFDVSHMGRLRVRGTGAADFLQGLCTRNLAGQVSGQSRYSHMCRPDGGILDDVIVSQYAPDDWLVVCNGANRPKIVSWLNENKATKDVALEDETLETAMIALQGPATRGTVAELLPLDLSDLKRYRFVSGSALGMAYTIFRSGYTGEDGYELIVPRSAVSMVAAPLLGSAEEMHPVIRPAGLGARDTLRLEAGMPLYGQELTEQWDPITAGQAWCVDTSVDFVGADALRRIEKDGPSRMLVGLEIEGPRIARTHTPVLANGKQVGEVTSGTMSPTLGKNIAMAIVSASAAGEGAELQVDLRGKPSAAKVVKLPFYRRPKGK